MKVEELMKGNWVFSKRFQRPVQIVTVASKVSYYVDGVLRTEKVGDVSPIPLSVEVLEKNGFNKIANRYFNLDLHIYLREIYDGGFFMPISVREIQIEFVHQLQQIFTLCGIEKEITLDGISVKEG